VPKFVSLDLKAMRHSAAYDLLVSTVQPRPIAFVSTLNRSGKPNLAPFSFFMAGGVNPPSLVFCPVLLPTGEPKDSLRNIEETGEYVVNLVTREMAEGMNATSFDYPHGFDEWAVSGFSAIPSVRVAPSRVEQSPVQFECRVFQIVRHGVGRNGTTYVIGEILQAHVFEVLWDGEKLLRERFLPLGRLGGPRYVDLSGPEIFTMPRPTEGAEPSLGN